MSRILVVEDEAHLAQGLQFNLEAEGHEVTAVENGEAALQLLLTEQVPFEAMVLDVMLPGCDGFTVATELRKARNYIPILMLTARSRPEDVLKGFESGTDDYLPKPFDLSILIARIRGLLRRTAWMQHERPAEIVTASNSNEAEVYHFGNKAVDLTNLELRDGDDIVRLTLMEVDLLRYFIRNAGRVISRKEILDEVWGLREDTDTRAIDNFVVRLRRYIEDEPSHPRRLVTARGVGYRFVEEPAKET